MPKLLVADDDPNNRDMLGRRLMRRGYEIVFARDGEEAVALAASESPDAILMDLSMPVLDGWKATAQLKASPTTKHIPVIAFTSHKINGEDAIMAGFDGYALKPVEFDSLMKQVEALLNSTPEQS